MIRGYSKLKIELNQGLLWSIPRRSSITYHLFALIKLWSYIFSIIVHYFQRISDVMGFYMIMSVPTMAQWQISRLGRWWDRRPSEGTKFSVSMCDKLLAVVPSLERRRQLKARAKYILQYIGQKTFEIFGVQTWPLFQVICVPLGGFSYYFLVSTHERFCRFLKHIKTRQTVFQEHVPLSQTIWKQSILEYFGKRDEQKKNNQWF